LASGLLAGGAIMGVISAILKYAGVQLSTTQAFQKSDFFSVLAVVAYIGLIIYLIIHSLMLTTLISFSTFPFFIPYYKDS
jgi:ABC-type Co2+ transport system permease subunit